MYRLYSLIFIFFIYSPPLFSIGLQPLMLKNTSLILDVKPSLLNKATNQSLHLTSTAFTFFAALGAISIVELITQYENNPVVIDQFIESQSDPIGQLALGAFVLSQGWTHSTLEHITQHSKLRAFIPYLGMTVGLIASQVVIETSLFMPELKQCLYQRSKCDQLLKKWEEYPLKEERLHQLFPGLLSMFSSTFLAGVLEMGLHKSLSYIGFEVLTSSTPAGLSIKIARGIYQVSRFAGFFYIDYLLVDPIDSWWQNQFGIGHQVSQQRQLLSNYLNHDDLASVLSDYLDKNAKWLDFQARKMYQKQLVWNKYFTDLIESYFEAQGYYGFLIEHFHQFQIDPKRLTPILNQEVTLLGIFQNQQTLPSWNDYIYRPIETQLLQINFINQVTSQFVKKAQKIQWQPYEKQIISKIFHLLQQKDALSIAQGLHIVRNYLRIGVYPASYQQSQSLYRFLFALKQKLGPQVLPLVGQGTGFFWVGLLMQQNHQNFTQFDEKLIQSKLNKYLNTIFNGPVRESDSFKFNRFGYPAQFIPPKLFNPFAPLISRSFAPWEPLTGRLQMENQKLNSTNGPSLVHLMAGSPLPHSWLQGWNPHLEESLDKSLLQIKLKYSDVLVSLKETLLNNNLLQEHNRVTNELIAITYNNSTTPLPISTENWVLIMSQNQPIIQKKILETVALYQLTGTLIKDPKNTSTDQLKELKLLWSNWSQQHVLFIQKNNHPVKLKNLLILQTQKHTELIKAWISALQLFDKNSLTGIDRSVETPCLSMSNAFRHLNLNNCP